MYPEKITTPAKARGNSTPTENGKTIPATRRIKVPANKLCI